MTTQPFSGALKTLFSSVLLAGALALTAGSAAAEDKLKVGFIYVSPIGDAGWTFQHDIARKAIEEKFGDKIEVKVIDSVPEGAEAERVTRELAASGHQLIFGTSFGYMNPMLKVAKMFPKTHFEHATGYKTAKNLGNYNARFYEGRYLSGIIAGSMTKTNKLAYVAAFPIPEVLQGINAYIRGAQSVNPDVELNVVWTNSWFDPGREREASDALIDQGADVVTHHTDSTAPTVAAEEKGVYSVAYHSDMSKYGEKAHLTAVTHHWDNYYTKVVQAALDGKWEPGSIWGGIKDEMINLAPMNEAVPEEVVAKVEAAKAAIVDGSLHPFAGPVVDQDGKEIVAEGTNMSDEDMSKMGFYVKGVNGKLPK
ncbi:MAG: Nucleoside ABC transporter, periplasmic nucleoside-binding protein [uncultured Thiotrichaceae bacterium]|uniref:Nucleoside ABC transporter, periplasmic nucleoside-binding protein n=1 Tax=uncultured Thiotrichaceae bacterium TaxID=298394 RepID=A0A6S6U5E5_9GAMM|nr:MAG: Nucleoside ABC transporter, periplasmic nucleoside-binding protein [uncultured Thiotrichaceae bacterium]